MKTTQHVTCVLHGGKNGDAMYPIYTMFIIKSTCYKLQYLAYIIVLCLIATHADRRLVA